VTPHCPISFERNRWWLLTVPFVTNTCNSWWLQIVTLFMNIHNKGRLHIVTFMINTARLLENTIFVAAFVTVTIKANERDRLCCSWQIWLTLVSEWHAAVHKHNFSRVSWLKWLFVGFSCRGQNWITFSPVWDLWWTNS